MMHDGGWALSPEPRSCFVVSYSHRVIFPVSSLELACRAKPEEVGSKEQTCEMLGADQGRYTLPPHHHNLGVSRGYAHRRITVEKATGVFFLPRGVVFSQADYCYDSHRRRVRSCVCARRVLEELE